MYQTCFQYTQLSPKYSIYACVDSSLCSSSIFCCMIFHLLDWNSFGGKQYELIIAGQENTIYFKLHVCINLFISSTLVLLIYSVIVLCYSVFQRHSDDSFNVSGKYKCKYWKIIKLWRWCNGCWQIYYWLWRGFVLRFVNILEIRIGLAYVMNELFWKQLVITPATDGAKEGD